jgi:hypothetical protein
LFPQASSPLDDDLEVYNWGLLEVDLATNSPCIDEFDLLRYQEGAELSCFQGCYLHTVEFGYFDLKSNHSIQYMKNLASKRMCQFALI